MSEPGDVSLYERKQALDGLKPRGGIVSNIRVFAVVNRVSPISREKTSLLGAIYYQS